MTLETTVTPYLNGEKFSNALPVKIATREKLFSRIDWITDYAKQKRIIHVGCADHIPVILEKVKADTWLYSRIEKVASRQLGIDITKDAVDYIRDNLGISNILCMDIIKDAVPREVSTTGWDAMVMGELLEHIDNPVEFLSTIHQKYGAYVRELVITVPNALSIANFYQAARRNTEKINTDHRYWFTPFTLQKILMRAGFTPIGHEFASYYPLNKKKKIRNYFLRQVLERRPVLRSNLIMRASFA